MWTREYIKNYAKDFLRRHYWKAFLVCLIAWFLGGIGSNSINYKKTNQYENYRQNNRIIHEERVNLNVKNPVLNFGLRKMGLPFGLRIAKGIIALTAFGAMIFSIAVGNIIEVGKIRFFLKGFKGDAEIASLFSAFNSEEYFGILKTQFLRGLYNFLWSLLLIIPGIIKSYEYKMVPYILSEEPNIPSDEAIRMSRFMTDGHKWSMFVLDLSFLGWYLLGVLLLGLGSFFVLPYEEATYAKLYNVLSEQDDGYYGDEYHSYESSYNVDYETD